MRYVLLALLIGAVAACDADRATNSPAVAAPSAAPVVDMHTSRNSLDWSGAYEGLLACEDCAGIHMRLTLNQDESFEIATRRLVRDAASDSARGRFEWETDGNTIMLDAGGSGLRFAVGEGRLTFLETGQARPAAAVPGTVLARESPDWRDAEQDLAGLLQDHHWMIVNATDGANQRIDALFLDAEQSLEFRFDENRLHVQGGCNGLRAAFQVGADDRLEVTGAMSTQMACEPPLMEADATLAALMAEPLQLVRVRGLQPTLVMLTATGDALVLTGELTPEARFGPPATIFLEIAAQAVACDGSTRGDGLCLQVRERNFDEQGLLVGTPSEWQPFTADIQGYEHQPGIRNVVRVKRFQPPAEAGMAAELSYVLDLMVESEVVPQ